MPNKFKHNKGFTIVELIIVLVLFAVLFSSTSIVFGNMLSEYGMGSEASKIVQFMREARMNAVSQKDNSEWGVNFITSGDPDRYIMFKGSSYLSRDPAFDIDFALPKNILIENINLGGGNEIVFNKRSGYTSNGGSFSYVNDNEQINFTINSLGLIDYK